MNTDQLLNAYREYAAAESEADAKFDAMNILNLPARPEFTAAAHAGQLIQERGLSGALKVAEFGIEDPDCSEATKTAYQLIIEAAR